jgi:hypothetical protein
MLRLVVPAAWGVLGGALCVSCIAEQDLGDREQTHGGTPDRVGGRIDWTGPSSAGGGGPEPQAVASCTGCPEGMIRLGSPLRVDLEVEPGGYYCAPHAPVAPRSPDCGEAFEDCSGECVDFEAHPDHCGGCDQVCPTPGFGHRLCQQSSCKPCGAGFLKCSAAAEERCVDPSTDREHCGGCSIPCSGVCQDGSCLSNDVFTLLEAIIPEDFAVDGEHIFANEQAMGGQIVRVPQTGGTPTVIAQDTRARRFATDEDHIYWSDTQAGAVLRADKYGGDVQLIANGARPFGIALHGDHLYWADEGEPMPGPLQGGSIQRVPKSGGESELVLPLPGASGREIAVDDTHVYFTKLSKSGSTQATLQRVPLGGGEPEAVGGSSFVGLAVDGNQIYGLQQDGTSATVQAYTKSADVTVLGIAQFSTSEPAPVAISDKYLYFGSYRSPKCGGAIGNYLPKASRIKAVGGHVYWIEGDSLFRRPE